MDSVHLLILFLALKCFKGIVECYRPYAYSTAPNTLAYLGKFLTETKKLLRLFVIDDMVFCLGLILTAWTSWYRKVYIYFCPCYVTVMTDFKI
jgi:hypothetical protein